MAFVRTVAFLWRWFFVGLSFIIENALFVGARVETFFHPNIVQCLTPFEVRIQKSMNLGLDNAHRTASRVSIA